MTQRALTIPFVKAHACGNDFLIVDADRIERSLRELTRRLCDRHRGVGADGVEWLYADPSADVRAQLINSDGSEAEISGNGTRCVAAHICSSSSKQEVAIKTGAGVKTCRLISANGDRYEFETAMGEPQIAGDVSVSLESRQVKAVSVSMGNPHLTIFVDEFSNSWPQEAAEIAAHADVMNGVNVEFVVIRDAANIDARFFERGAGETQSSGTGSCAAAVASIFTGRAKSPVNVIAQGGAQTVRWDGEVYLRGPAHLICSGEFFVDEK